VSRSGKVLAPVKLWCDTATVAECEQITAAVGGEQACLALGGNTIAAGFTASKILRLKKNKTAAYAEMTSIMLPHDYLNYHLTDRRVMELGDASGTGLLNVRKRIWSDELIAALDGERDLRRCFPDLIRSDEVLGFLRPDLAKQFGFRTDVLVSSGGGDNMMAAIGTGNLRPGCLTASMGTSGTLFAYSDKPVVDEQGELAAFCSSNDAWLPLLCTMNCTVATEQLRSLFDLDLERSTRLAAAVPEGADGLLTLPFYNGERTPNLPNAKATIFGLDMDNTTQGHLLRSAMEAAVFGLKTGLLAFQRHGMEFEQVTLTGGGSRSALWCQMCADVLGLPVKVLQERENAAFGALLQALWCYRRAQGQSCDLGKLADQHLLLDESKCCVPRKESVLAYQIIYEKYTSLLKTLTPIYKQ
jgi:xylulokinase